MPTTYHVIVVVAPEVNVGSSLKPGTKAVQLSPVRSSIVAGRPIAEPSKHNENNESKNSIVDRERVKCTPPAVINVHLYAAEKHGSLLGKTTVGQKHQSRARRVDFGRT